MKKKTKIYFSYFGSYLFIKMQLMLRIVGEHYIVWFALNGYCASHILYYKIWMLPLWDCSVENEGHTPRKASFILYLIFLFNFYYYAILIFIYKCYIVFDNMWVLNKIIYTIY